jgi:hypothetical protein
VVKITNAADGLKLSLGLFSPLGLVGAHPHGPSSPGPPVMLLCCNFFVFLLAKYLFLSPK